MKYKIIILSMLLAFVLSGCSDFLEESSQDEIRPTTVDDLIQLMTGEVYPMTNVVCTYLELMTDNAICNGMQNQNFLETYLISGRSVFGWEDSMYEDLVGKSGMTSWASFYTRIMGCNTVLAYLDKVKGNDDTRANLKGQALTMRAWSYFFLVNLYGQPCTVGDPKENLGVPLKLVMDVEDEYLSRNTVFEVYEQVEEDLLEGIRLLEEYKVAVPLYKASPLMAKALLSRVYLYMGNWDEAIKYATEVLDEKSSLVNLAQGADITNAVFTKLYDVTASNEILWVYGREADIKTFFDMGGFGYHPAYQMSNELRELYEDNDLRLLANHTRMIDFTTYQMYYCYGYKGTSTDKGSKGIRTAEVYLNRAEANIQKYMATNEAAYRTAALADLNTLRANRYNSQSAVYENIEDRSDIDISTPEKLYHFYQDERRRELDFEDHRWFDLRRMGMPRIEHKYFVNTETDGQTFILEANSLKYVLPIPQAARDRNPYLVPNPR